MPVPPEWIRVALTELRDVGVRVDRRNAEPGGGSAVASATTSAWYTVACSLFVRRRV